MMTESDLQEIRQKQKRRNQILFSKESDCLRVLFDALASAPRRTVTCWAFACAEPIKDELAARYPLDPRPAEAFVLSKAWAQGEIKMPIAKRAILAVHAMAKDMPNDADAALCHALGQACSVVHTPRHAPGLPLYKLTAIVCRLGIDDCKAALEQTILRYEQTLSWCQKHPDDGFSSWAPFLK